MPTVREPAPNVVVSAPAQVLIRFSEPLEPAFSKITLTGADAGAEAARADVTHADVTHADGNAALSATSAVDPQDRQTMRLALQPLTPGRYTVHWTAVASDGHRTHGDYAFTVK